MPGERYPQYPNDFSKDDLLELLLALQGKVNRELHVATLCVIESAVKDHVYRCSAFPKMPKRDAAMFNAICIKKSDRDVIDEALSDNKRLFAVALMTDLDSEANYIHDITHASHEAFESSSSLHSFNNAVIVYVGDPVGGYDDATP